MARLSTNERQAMNPDTRMEHSIDEQQKKIEDFVKKSSEINQIDKSLIFHGSAYKDSNYIKDFTNILKLNKNKVFLFTCVDRCSRNEAYFIGWKELCKQFCHKLIFIDDNITYPSDNPSIEHNLAHLVLTAQQYSDRISKNTKQVADRKRKRKSDDSNTYQNSPAFGRSFNRIYEIHILLIIQRLLSINENHTLKKTEINNLFVNIFNVMPIDKPHEKIQFLKDNPIKFEDIHETSIDVLIEPLTLEEIVNLFNGYGITYVDVANESNELPLCTNNSKFLINHPMVPENLYRVVHQRKNKREWLDFSLTDVVKQFFPTDNDQNIQNYINECFDLNPNVPRSQARKDLELNTLLCLPKSWKVPEENVPTDILLKNTKKYQGKFINIESEYKSFIQKCDSDEKFKKKVDDISDEVIPLLQNLSEISINNDDEDEQALKVQRLTAEPLPIRDEQNHPIWQNDVYDESSECKFCGYCGQKLKTNFIFCTKCGKSQ